MGKTLEQVLCLVTKNNTLKRIALGQLGVAYELFRLMREGQGFFGTEHLGKKHKIASQRQEDKLDPKYFFIEKKYQQN